MSDLAQQRTYLYLLYNEIIYDPLHTIYYNILTLNKNPEGLLKTYTKLTSLTKPSPRNIITECSFVIKRDLLNANSKNLSYSNILTLDDLNEFTEFLLNNNYVITDITYNNNNNNNTNIKKIIYSFKITL